MNLAIFSVYLLDKANKRVVVRMKNVFIAKGLVTC